MAPEARPSKIWENKERISPGAEITIGDDTVVKAVGRMKQSIIAFDVNRQGFIVNA